MTDVNPKCRISFPYAIISMEYDTRYGKLELLFKLENEEGCLSGIEEVDPFIKKKVAELDAQLENHSRYELVYREAFLHLDAKLAELQQRVAAMEFESGRAKFRYEKEEERIFYEEYFNELKAGLPFINEDNKGELLIHPYILRQIYGGQ